MGGITARNLITLAVLAITLVCMAGAANYMYEKASVKGVGYKNVEQIISTKEGFNGAKPLDHENFLSIKADIFIPAAMENQITAETAPLLNARLVAEGANGPTDPDGDTVLQNRGIEIIPDILCNAGGVVVSYFEWLQNKRSESWEIDEVENKLRKKILNAFERVRDTANHFDTDWRTAAYIVALSRLEKIYKERGIFP